MKIISSVDEYTRVYTRRNTRIYKIKKSGLDFCCGMLHTINLTEISSSKFDHTWTEDRYGYHVPPERPRIIQTVTTSLDVPRALNKRNGLAS